MSNKGSENLRTRIKTNFEFMQSLSPSKLAQFLRTKLAHNQGCPPVPLMQVFTMCQEYASCEYCGTVFRDGQETTPDDFLISNFKIHALKYFEYLPSAYRKGGKK